MEREFFVIYKILKTDSDNMSNKKLVIFLALNGALFNYHQTILITGANLDLRYKMVKSILELYP